MPLAIRECISDSSGDIQKRTRRALEPFTLTAPEAARFLGLPHRDDLARFAGLPGVEVTKAGDAFTAFFSDQALLRIARSLGAHTSEGQQDSTRTINRDPLTGKIELVYTDPLTRDYHAMTLDIDYENSLVIHPRFS